jgi:hypothetical protein
MRKPFPNNRSTKVTWRYIIDSLPSIKTCLKQIGMVSQLAMSPLESDTLLGSSFQIKYKFSSGDANRVVNEWHSNIEALQKEFEIRDYERIAEYGVGYPWLQPKWVAFSIQV